MKLTVSKLKSIIKEEVQKFRCRNLRETRNVSSLGSNGEKVLKRYRSWRYLPKEVRDEWNEFMSDDFPEVDPRQFDVFVKFLARDGDPIEYAMYGIGSNGNIEFIWNEDDGWNEDL